MKLFFSEDINKNIIHLKDEEAKQLRISALKSLSELSANPNERYYYLSSAEELSPTFKEPLLLKPTKAIIEN